MINRARQRPLLRPQSLLRKAILAFLMASSGPAFAQAPAKNESPKGSAPQVGASSAAEPTSTGQFELDDGVLYWSHEGSRSRVQLPGLALAMRVLGSRAYVALGEQGAAVVVSNADGGVVVEKLVPVSHGAVTGFMVQGNDVWMQVTSSSAIRLGGGGASSSANAPVTPLEPQPIAPSNRGAETPPKQPSAKPALDLSIVKVYDGLVLLDQGKAAGLRVGDRFKVVRRVQDSDSAGTFSGDQEVAVLVVDSLAEDSARARIWRGDSVQLGDSVEPIDKSAEPSLMYPRALSNFVEVEAHVRPILNIGDTGFGVLLDGNATYYADSFFAGLRSQPFGLGRTQGSTAFTQTLLAEGGYNSRPFAIGLGVGVTSVYGDLQEMFAITSLSGSSEDASGGATVPEYSEWKQELQHAPALEQRVRLGAMDGLNLTVSNTLLYFDGPQGRSADDENTGAGFIWGGTSTKLTIPLALSADLFFEGGGGVMGYGYGAIGVFGWLEGNGGPGSLGFLASAGGAGIWGARTRQNNRYGYTEEDSIEIGGPLVSFGLRYRFAVND